MSVPSDSYVDTYGMEVLVAYVQMNDCQSQSNEMEESEIRYDADILKAELRRCIRPAAVQELKSLGNRADQ